MKDDEVERIMAMSAEEIIAELRADGLDPEKVAAEGRAALDRAIAQVDAKRRKLH